jgi:nucleoside-diphosphate-sugar epimerase
MKILITGASGYIGSNLLKLIQIDVDNNIIALIKRDIFLEQNFKNVKYLKKNIEEIDKSFFLEHNFDIIYHFAWDNYKNVQSKHHLNSELKKQKIFIKQVAQNNIKKIFISGSGFEYGSKEGKLSETLECNPNIPYALAKIQLCDFIKRHFNQKQIYIWGRIFNIYGKNHHKQSLFGLIDSAAKNNNKIFKMTDGLQKRDYLFIDDLVLLIVKLVNNCNKSGIYNIGKGKSEKLRKIVNNYIKKNNYNIKIIYGAKNRQTYEPEEVYADTNKMEIFLNY